MGESARLLRAAAVATLAALLRERERERSYSGVMGLRRTTLSDRYGCLLARAVSCTEPRKEESSFLTQ